MNPFRFSALALALAGTLSAPALAGTPLLCHPIDPGDEPVLAWGEGAFGVDPGLPPEEVPARTAAVLDATDSVLAHMESIRRAVIYVSGIAEEGERSSPAAGRLLVALYDRAIRRDGTGAGPLALFDLGYAIQTMRQAGLAREYEGFTFLERALAARPGSPEIAFALALCASYDAPPGKEASKPEFLRAAREGAAAGSALERNLRSFFGEEAWRR